MEDKLLNITTMNINYLDNLDYVDISQLFKINTAYRKLTKKQLNDILRQILFTEGYNIVITPNFDIIKALDELYTKIEDLILINYGNKLPDWVDIEKFINYMKRKIVYYISLELSGHFESVDDDNKWGEAGPIDNLLFTDIPFPVKINKFVVGIPFVGGTDTDLYNDDFGCDRLIYNVIHEITLSNHFINYIKPTLIANQSRYIEEIMEKLLFIKHYVDTHL